MICPLDIWKLPVAVGDVAVGVDVVVGVGVVGGDVPVMGLTVVPLAGCQLAPFQLHHRPALFSCHTV